MMRNYTQKEFIIFLALLIANLVSPTAIFACSVCFQDPTVSATIGLRWGVLFLLGIVFAILTFFTKFFYNIHKRTRMLTENK